MAEIPIADVLQNVQKQLVIPTVPAQTVQKPKEPKKYRGWMLTINNPTQNDIDTLVGKTEKDIKYTYLIFQFEIGENGTLHVQGFIYFLSPRKLTGVKKAIPRAHLEPAKYINKCIAYCSKQETRVSGPFEYGHRPSQGKREDLIEIAEELKKPGVKVSHIAERFPAEYMMYTRGITAYSNIIAPHRTKAPTVYWLWGKSGVGKTTYARNLAKNPDSYYVKDASIWWDKYEQQEVILIDDFDEARFPFRVLLNLLDVLKMQGQTKGSYVEINSDYVAITCEFSPAQLWTDNDYIQVERRIDKVIEIVRPASYQDVVRKAKHERHVFDDENNLTIQELQKPAIPVTSPAPGLPNTPPQ